MKATKSKVDTCVARGLLSKPCGMWRVPHPLGVPGHWAFVPWQNVPRCSVMGGYDGKAA